MPATPPHRRNPGAHTTAPTIRAIPRASKVDLRQCQQRRAVGSVDDAKVLDIESGVPPIPPSREPVELDRLSDLAREHAGDLSPIALELGKDQETDSQQQYAKKRDQREQHATGYAQDRARQRGGGGSGRIGGCVQDGHGRLWATEFYPRARRSPVIFPMDLAEALEFSLYGARLRAAQPELVARVCGALDHGVTWSEDDVSMAREAADDVALATALRRLRQRVLLPTLLRDLTGRADLAEVCTTTTRLAEVAIDAAVNLHHRRLAQAHGEPIRAESGRAQRLLGVGLGKLGGGELNVSSDVDLVFVYPEDGTTAGPKSIANQEFFDRLGRRLIAALADGTADGS